MPRPPIKLRWVDRAEITDPRGNATVTVIRDAWWVVNDKNQLAFYGSAPQCNTDKQIAEIVSKRLYPQGHIEQISVAFVPINVGDY